MNIKDFLIDNYIWILVVILLCIITVIGFLADKKKGKKEKEPKNNNESMQNDAVAPINFQNQQQPMNYQPVGQMPINNNMQNFGPIPNVNVMPMNQNMNMEDNNMQNTIPQPMPNQNMVNIQQTPNVNPSFQNEMVNNMNNMQGFNYNLNNPQPVENINMDSGVAQEPLYQPLSEQTPVFAPRDVNAQIAAMHEQPEMLNIDLQKTNVVEEPVQNINMQPQMDTNPQVNMNMAYNQVPQNNNWNNQGQVMMNQPMQNPTVTNPQPQMNLNPQPNTIPNPVTEPQPVPTQPIPVNFVFGPQSNNNQNMQ